MINLIPNLQKHKMVKEFYLRLFILSIFVIGFSVVFAFIVLLPAYYMSTVQKNFISDKLSAQIEEPEPVVDPKTSAIVKDLDFKLSLVENTEKAKYLVSEKVIKNIIEQKMPDIKIEEIAYKNDPAAGKSVVVQGIAPSRERLLLFRQVLEDDVLFKKVDLPISNFVKGSNISFNLNLIPS